MCKNWRKGQARIFSGCLIAMGVTIGERRGLAGVAQGRLHMIRVFVVEFLLGLEVTSTWQSSPCQRSRHK
jgi:hypothetical protein